MRVHQRCSSGYPYVAAAMLLVLTAAACAKAERSVGAAPEEGGPPGVTNAALDLEPTAEMLAVLAGADRVDGAEDGTVSRCPGCSLAMEGHAEHALEIGGYELHFCSASCRDHFREHPETGLEVLRDAEQDPGVESGS